MYLFSACDCDGSTRAVVENVLTRHGLSVEEYVKGESITSRVHLTNHAVISEFPGNCSAIVLSNIQGSRDADTSIKAAIDIARDMYYALVFVSGTSGTLRSLLEANEFEVCLDSIFNPHSGSDNFFMVYRTGIDVDEEEDYGEEYEGDY